MKTTTFPCVDLHVTTQNSALIVGEGRNGRLTMTEDGERFEFEECTSTRCIRNQKVWSGHRINISKDVFGHYHVNLRRLELNDQTNPRKVANEIQNELKAAKEELGL